jgi:hypothetical protein
MTIGIRQQAVGSSRKLKFVPYALSAMLFALCSSVEAQQPAKVARIGFLDAGTAAGSAVLVETFRR